MPSSARSRTNRRAAVTTALPDSSRGSGSSLGGAATGGWRRRRARIRATAPEQQIREAEARAVDRFALRTRLYSSCAQFQERIRLAVMPDQPHAAIAAQGRAAEVEAGQPRVRPREPARRLARTPHELPF